MNNIEIFKDTLRTIERDRLLSERTKHSAEKTVIYPPHTRSAKAPSGKNTKILVQETTTLQAARELRRTYQHVAMLNFANPVEPGGGVWRGANAQEESLCRASNLYPCLAGDQAAAYYRDQQALEHSHRMMLSSDHLLYTPDVTFFKDDNLPNPSVMDHLMNAMNKRRGWFTSDVITCAAPYFASEEDRLPDDELEMLFISRIQNILETAIEHDEDALVLGAFGCGAFHNPPLIVARAFRNVLHQQRYSGAFHEIRFAIKPPRIPPCRNTEAFRMYFPDSAI